MLVGAVGLAGGDQLAHTLQPGRQKGRGVVVARGLIGNKASS